MQKIAQTVIDEQAKLCDIKLLAPYVNQNTKIPAECLICGHQWAVNPICLKRGQRCPRCAARKCSEKMTLPVEEVHDRLRQKGYELVGPYSGSHRGNLQVRCLKAGHLHEAQASFFLSAKKPAKCPQCTFETSRARLLEKVREAQLELLEQPVLSTNGVRKQKLEVRCLVCGHTWKTKEFKGCPQCKREAQTLDLITLRRRLAIHRLVVLRYTPTDRKTHTRAKIRVRCIICAHEFNVFSSATSYTDTHGCPRCLKKERGSFPEKDCIEIIERLTGWDFPRVRPSWLKGRSPQPMELDGYNEEHQIAIEFQGPQHYKPIYGERNFKITKRNDKRKRELARYRGVLLICVPHWKKNPEDFIRKKLIRAGILTTSNPD